MNNKKGRTSPVNSLRVLQRRLPESADFLKHSSWALFCNFPCSEFLFKLMWCKLSMNFFPKIDQKYLCDDSLFLYLLILLALLVVMNYAMIPFFFFGLCRDTSSISNPRSCTSEVRNWLKCCKGKLPSSGYVQLIEILWKIIIGT